jgi:hypothetical protein
MARQQQEKLAAVTTGSAKSTGIPCAMVLTVSFVLSRGPGFLAPVISEIIISPTWHQRRDARATRLRRPQ